MRDRNPFTNAKVVRVNADPEAYHAQTAKRGEPAFFITRSALMQFQTCPARWVNGYQDADSKATEWGTLIDNLVLDAARFPDRFAVTPESYPGTPKKKGDPIIQKPWNSSANYCEAWKLEQGGKIIVKSKDLTQARRAVRALQADHVLNAYISQSDRQVLVTADYLDPATSVRIPVKALIDLVPRLGTAYAKSIGDLKTCESAHPAAWKKAVFQRNYHVQAAMYLDLFTAATGEDRIEFHHVLSESEWPFQIGRRILGSTFIEMGRARYRDALAFYSKCVLDQHWPDYDELAPRALGGWQFTEPEEWMINR